jgi:nucleotidyltransferase/DNA polymerase involved in DNA repair
MRIACVHVPQFALQSLGRIDPSLRGAAVAVVGAGLEPANGARPSVALHSPVVLACSRAAWALGVRLGMTATAARFVSPQELRVVTADAALERETVRALADALLGASAVVDSGGRVGASAAHLAMYCEVPSKMRGATFGARLLELLDSFGIAARIGIADDRFTAWVAAAHGAEGGHAREDRGVVSVPRGGSAAFLAPRPLSLLAITPEVQHMLEALGVRTLGEFAALPAPSVSRPLEADYQALARGDSGCALRPYAPDAPIREQLAVAGGDSLFGASAAVATLAERLALRLSGRGRGAARLELRISGEQGERAVALSGPSAAFTAEELAELLLPQIGEAPGQVTRLGVVVAGEAIAGVQAVPAEREAAIGTAATGPIAAGGTAGQVDRGEDSVIDALSAALSVARGGSTRPRPDRADREDGRSLPWQLSAAPTLRAERRDAHRRTRRARRRRIATPAQPLLFGQADG